MKKKVKMIALVAVLVLVFVGIKPVLSTIMSSLAAGGTEATATPTPTVTPTVTPSPTSTPLATLPSDSAQLNEAHKVSARNPEITENISMLEIAPYKGMGEFGYQVSGQEPFSEWEDGLKESTNRIQYVDYLNSTYLNTTFSGKIKVEYKELTEEEWQDKWNSSTISLEEKEKYKIIPIKTKYEENPVAGHMFNGPMFNQDYTQRIKKGSFYCDDKGTYDLEFQTEETNAKVPGKYRVLFEEEANNQDGDYDKIAVNGEQLYVYNKYHKGYYNVIFAPDASGTYFIKDYKINKDRKGKYNCLIDPTNDAAEYEYTPGTGNYTWTTGSGSTTMLATDHNAQTVYLDAFKPVDYDKSTRLYYYGNSINPDYFKSHVLECDTKEKMDNTRVTITVMTPKEINKEVEKSKATGETFFKNFDLIHVVSDDERTGTQDTSYIPMWEHYSNEGRALGNDRMVPTLGQIITTQKTPKYIGTNDLSWEATEELFNRVGVEQSTAIIFNTGSYIQYADKGSSNNVFKAFLMLNYSNSEWTNINSGIDDNRQEMMQLAEYIEKDSIFSINVSDKLKDNLITSDRINKIDANNKMHRTTGLYNKYREKDSNGAYTGPEKEVYVWKHDTFGPNAVSSQYGHSQLVADNVYVMDGSMTFGKDFTNEGKYGQGSFQQAIDHKNNSTKPAGTATTVSPAEVIKYILASSQVPTITILNDDAINTKKGEVVIYLDYDITDPLSAINGIDKTTASGTTPIKVLPIEYMISAKKSIEPEIIFNMYDQGADMDTKGSKIEEQSKVKGSVEINKKYIYDFPIATLDNKNGHSIFLEAINDLNGKKTEVKCTIIRRNLFNLE